MSKPTDLMKPVSGRQFARMVGQAESAVRKAAERKSINTGKNDQGKFIPLIAAREWGKTILPEFAGGVGVTFPEPAKPAAPAKPKPQPKAIKLKPLIPTTPQELIDDEFDDDEDPEDDIESGPLTDDSPKHEAERRTAIFKARTAELLYQEKKGEMIPRSKMRVLYEYGSQVRSAFEALPNKIIDDILANAEDRQAALRILVEGVHETLTKLADPEKLNL